jgi:hypothetical protein
MQLKKVNRLLCRIVDAILEEIRGVLERNTKDVKVVQVHVFQ